MNILVTGGSGLLGSWIKKVCAKDKNNKYYFPESCNVDITDKESTRYYCINNNIKCIINCAAFTDVDESENLRCISVIKVNCLGVENLIEICIENNIKLIHISTDYVFNCEQSSFLLQEVDIPNPSNRYGMSKLYAEKIIQKYLPKNNYLIIRTSWLYDSEHGFVSKIIKKPDNVLKVVNDEFGTPTHARNLADAIISNIDKMTSDLYGGLYHFADSIDFPISRYKLASYICDIMNSDKEVVPISSVSINSFRPYNSGLNCNKFKRDFKYVIPDWVDSLRDVIYNNC